VDNVDSVDNVGLENDGRSRRVDVRCGLENDGLDNVGLEMTGGSWKMKD